MALTDFRHEERLNFKCIIVGKNHIPYDFDKCEADLWKQLLSFPEPLQIYNGGVTEWLERRASVSKIAGSMQYWALRCCLCYWEIHLKLIPKQVFCVVWKTRTCVCFTAAHIGKKIKKK